MSFILDALKKSENERQKQTGPALYEVKVAPPQRRFPVWAVVVGMLLGVNLIVLTAVLLMRDRQDPAVQAVQAQVAANAAGQGAAGSAPAAAGSPMGAYGAPGGIQGTPPQGAATSAPGALAPAAGATLGPDGLPVATGTLQPSPGPAPASAGTMPGAAPSTRFNPPLVEEDPSAYEEAPNAPRGTPINPADYMAATAGPTQQRADALPQSGMPQPSGYPMTAGAGPATPPGSARPGNVRTASAIPSRDDLVASGMGDIPPAALSLHVYDKNPAARFVFVNGQRAREGDTLQNGLRVDEITAEGAVLSFRGSRFLLPLQ